MPENTLKRELMRFRKSDLIEFCKLLKISDMVTGKKEDIVNYLIDQYPDDTKKILDCYERIRKIKINHAKAYLSSNYPETLVEIESIRGISGLLIYIYKHDIINQIDMILNNSGIQKIKQRVKYIVQLKDNVDWEEFDEKFIYFINEWNENNIWKLSGDYTLITDDTAITLIFYVEKGKHPIQTFKFRSNGDEYAPNDMEIVSNVLIPVYRKSVELIKISKNAFQLTSTFDHSEHWFTKFIFSCFGENSITPFYEDKVREFGAEVMNEAKQGIIAISQLIDRKRENVIKEITANPNITDEQKSNLKNIISTIKYIGPTLKNDPITRSRELTLLVDDYSIADEIIPLTPFINELYKKIPQAKEHFCISVNNKVIILSEAEGKYIQKTRLSEVEQASLNIFLGVGNE